MKEEKSTFMLWKMLVTTTLFLMFGSLWMLLEQLIDGQVTSRLVDNLISIPVIVSFWFNAERIMDWLMDQAEQILISELEEK